VVVALLALGSLTVPALAQDRPVDDGGVTRATDSLDRARQQVSDINAALDATAEQYEQANAHRVRIADELADADAVVEQAQQAVAVAEQQLSDRIATAYKHPMSDMAITDALFRSPDAPTALHRTMLYRRIVQRSAGEVDVAKWASDLTTTDVQQERVIAAGAQASVDEWKRQSHALTSALRTAKDSVAQAQEGLDVARVEAARLIEERRRAEAARLAQSQVLTIGNAPAGPAPSIEGRTCPVGGPNGFIDSWGFPRPGGRTHEGVDIFAAYGTPLYAVAKGDVYRVYNNPIGGLSINLIDEAGNMYYYTHMSSATVVTGQKVTAGQVIGAVGTSGNAAGTPPHLHWQFHPGNGSPINPYPLAYALCR
jgi:murein DD-endopeptidase MepM/ murein hydrolase activator NlpD